MTPEEKAKELYSSFDNELVGLAVCLDKSAYNYVMKICSIVCCNEILDGHRKLLIGSRKYWEDVKTEVEKFYSEQNPDKPNKQ